MYTSDPAKKSSSRLIKELSYDQFLAARYNVMDQVAVEICRENRLPIIVFDLADPEAMSRISRGEPTGTIIH